MLVHFPIASWTATVAVDLIWWIWRIPVLAQAGLVCVAAGLATGALAIIAGFLDYAAIAPAHPAQRIATAHMLVMSTAWLAFLVGLMGRLPTGWQTVSVWVTVADVVGFLIMLGGAQLGGSLVYRFSVGVASSG